MSAVPVSAVREEHARENLAAARRILGEPEKFPAGSLMEQWAKKVVENDGR